MWGRVKTGNGLRKDLVFHYLGRIIATAFLMLFSIAQSRGNDAQQRRGTHRPERRAAAVGKALPGMGQHELHSWAGLLAGKKKSVISALL